MVYGIWYAVYLPPTFQNESKSNFQKISTVIKWRQHNLKSIADGLPQFWRYQGFESAGMVFCPQKKKWKTQFGQLFLTNSDSGRSLSPAPGLSFLQVIQDKQLPCPAWRRGPRCLEHTGIGSIRNTTRTVTSQVINSQSLEDAKLQVEKVLAQWTPSPAKF